MSKQKLLFVTYGGGHVNAIIPVIKEVQKNNIYDYEVLALTAAVKILRSNNINFKQMKDFCDEEIIKLGIPLARKYHKEDSDVSFEETVAYYGSGMKDLILDYGLKGAYEKFDSDERKAFLPVNKMKSIIKEIGADMVIATSSPRTEKAALIAARLLNRPALRIEQLFYANDVDLPRGVHFAVLNEIIRDKLLLRGIDAEYINVTGQPAFDKLKIERPYNKITSLRDRLKIRKEHKIVMWASPGNKDQSAILDKLIEIEKKNDNIQLIIKLHPNESGELQKNIVRAKRSKTLVMDSNLHELILLSNLVITEFSAVGLEAIFLDRPLLTINLFNIKGQIPYAESGAAIEVQNLNKLEDEMNNILYNHETQRKLGLCRRRYNNDGKAAMRVYNLIEEIFRKYNK